MTDIDDGYYDARIEELIPWREFSPEEYLARHWLEFGAFSVAKKNYLNKDLQRWVQRFEELFHDTRLIEECRARFLTAEERTEQDAVLRRIDENGF